MSQEVVRLEVCADMLTNEIRRTGQELSNANASIRNLESLVIDLRALVVMYNTTLRSIEDMLEEHHQQSPELSSMIDRQIQECRFNANSIQDKTDYDLGIPGNEIVAFADPICRA